MQQAGKNPDRKKERAGTGSCGDPPADAGHVEEEEEKGRRDRGEEQTHASYILTP